jgi:hypothetical protein
MSNKQPTRFMHLHASSCVASVYRRFSQDTTNWLVQGGRACTRGSAVAGALP